MFTASAINAVTALLVGLSPVPTGAVPPTVACPAPVPAETSCYAGQDSSGAFYTIAIPGNWNGSLVMHAHGGPDLGAPTQDRSIGDLGRWSVMVREGYAWAGSSYRRGGFGTQMAGDDTETLRHYFTKYRASVTNAGNARYLVQTFTQESEHSALSDSGYASVISALATWVRTGHKPTPASVAAACPAMDKKYGTGCFFDPEFSQGSYESTVYPRHGGWFWPALNPWQAKLWSKIPGVGIAP